MTCEDTQAALTEGTADPAQRAHAEACDECRFFVELSRAIGGGPRSDAAFVETGVLLAGRWQIEARLGRGGQGEVYRAEDVETHRRVALKIVRCTAADDDGAEELANAQRVDHPNICPVYYTARHGQLRLIEMKLLDGPTLAEVLPGLPMAPALALFRGVAEAIEAAHRADVLHLDLKPANVLMHGGRPLVTDFGLSVAGGGVARGGTVAFMAPEHARGAPVDRRADVYALGVMLRGLAGRSPPRALRRAITWATEDDPRQRCPDVTALLRAIAPRPRWQRATLAVLPMVGVLGALPFVWPRATPAGWPPRAAWRDDLWGVDLVPGSMVNLARGAEVTADGLPQGCSRSLADLTDGEAQYHNWQRGWAFAGPAPICVSLQSLDACGGPRAGAALCELASAGARPVPGVRYEDRATTGIPDDRLGQLEPGVDCDLSPTASSKDISLTVTFDQPRRVRTVRAWFHGADAVPWELKVVTENGDVAREFTGRDLEPARYRTVEGGNSGPITVDFTPQTTAWVRLVMDPCSTREAATDWKTRGQLVWLYELEVFGEPARIDR